MNRGAHWLVAFALLSASLSMPQSADRHRRGEQIFSIEALVAKDAAPLEEALGKIEGKLRAQIVWENSRFKLLIGAFTDEQEALRATAKIRETFPGAFVRPVLENPISRRSTRRDFLSSRPLPEDSGWTYDRALPQVHLVRALPRSQRFLMPDPDIPVPDQETRQCEERNDTPADHLPDERPLWELLASGRLDAVDTAMADMSRAFPRWTPPRDLLRVLEEKRLDRSIDEAVLNGEWSRLIRLAETHPERLGCERIDLLWNLARAYVEEQAPQDALMVYRSIIPHCENARHRLATLEKARTHLGSAAMIDLLRREESASKEEPAEISFQDFRYDVFRSIIFEESEHSRRERILEKIDEIRDQSILRRDDEIAMLAGWTHHGLGRHERAAAWFERALSWSASSNRREQAAFGLSRSLKELGRAKEEISLLREWSPRSSRMAALLQRRYGECGDIAFEEQDYLAALEYFESAEEMGDIAQGQARAKAWSLFQLGEFDEAARAFEALYRATPDRELADGLDASLSASESWMQYAQLAETLSGPIAVRWNRHRAQREASRKLFLLAASRASPDQHDLSALDSASGSLNLASRTKSGARGTSFLVLQKTPALRSEWIVDSLGSLTLRVDRVRLDNGETTLDEGVEVDLRFFREGWTSWYASVGRTPSGGAAPPRPTFSIGAIRESESRAETSSPRWAAEVSARPLRETLLSYTGSIDPETGLAWGGVLQTGVIIDHSRRIGRNWGFSARLEWSALDGLRVAANQRRSLYAALTRNSAIPKLDHFAAGPYLYLDGFSKDSSGFRIGDGGYFSPRSLVQTGLAAHLQSREGRAYIFRGRGSFGYQQQRDHGGFAEDGATFTLDGEFLWSASHRVRIGAGFSFRRTAGYADRSFQIVLGLSAKARRTLFSRDFAPLNPLDLY